MASLRIPGAGAPPPVVGVLRLAGIIGRLGPVHRGLSLGALASAIERAFRLPRLKAVALTINSPGGSAVQSGLIQRRIRSLAEEKEMPVIAFTEDVAASGGYWLACAADEIFADENSIIGSIGVLHASFGFPELLRRVGVERRVHKAGERKAMLDPFQPEDAEDVERLTMIQRDVHDAFKSLVRARRGNRLNAPEETLFSGEFWSGRRALELGLIDGIGDLRQVMRDRFGDKVQLRLVNPERGWLARRFRYATGPADPAEWMADALALIDERLMWGRYGL
ncbi:MAG: S49 family peptidase [Kiloniellales bacterium]